ncbi:MAG: A/G-specific adenine glycosylase [Verrucomicrobiae bacterium]|nr:A/G-specific adenine glycosylase [Verrucomicrobiae bacterium]
MRLPAHFDAQAFDKRLRKWFSRHQRDLPWRHDRTAYRVWISEIMLQQTTVATVIAYYQRWMTRFPDVASLARAPLESVLSLWEGLGYYSRARNVHKAAGLIVKDHNGEFPRQFEEILALPGIGRYSAGAIGSMALGLRVPLLDGNVARVFARLFRIRGNLKSPALQKRLWQRAADILPRSHCGDFNEALMELGATVCTPHKPACDRCPVAAFCAAHSHGQVAVFPRKVPRRKMLREEEFALVFIHKKRVLLEKIADGQRFAGFWRFPLTPEKPSAKCPRLDSIPYTFTHHRITLHFYGVTRSIAATLFGPDNTNCFWIPLTDLDKLPLPAAHRRFAKGLHL